MAKGKMGVMQTQFQKTPMMGAMANGKAAGKGKDDGIDSSQKVWVGSLPEGISQEDIAGAFGACGTVIKAAPMKNNTACVAYSTAAEAQSAIETFNGGDFNGSTLVVDVWTQRTPKGEKGGATKGGFGVGAKGGFGCAATKGGFGALATKGSVGPKAGFSTKASFGGFKGGKAAPAWAPAPASFAGTKGPMKGGFGAKASFGKGKTDGKGPQMRDYDNSQKVWVGNLPAGITQEDLTGAFGVAGTVKLAFVMKGNTAAIAFESAAEAQYAIEALNGGDLNGSILEVDVWTQREKGEGKGVKGGFKGNGKGFKGKL